MASFKALQPLARQAPRFATRGNQYVFKRFLNYETAPTLYTAHATVTGGRSKGHAEGDEGLNVDMTPPKSLGGNGGKTNPEELFAAGYGACFQGAMNASAAKLGFKFPEGGKDNIIESTVHLLGDGKALDFGIRVDMKVKIKGLKKEDVEKVIEMTKEVCPYSRATKGNVTTNVEVEII